MIYMFCLYHFCLKCIIKKIIYNTTIPKLNEWIWCSYRKIHFTIINRIYIYMHKKITNQNKGQVHQTILFSKLHYWVFKQFIMNVSVEPNLPWKNCTHQFFHFPSSFLSDHSDPLKKFNFPLMPTTGNNSNHLKT